MAPLIGGANVVMPPPIHRISGVVFGEIQINSVCFLKNIKFNSTFFKKTKTKKNDIT